MEKLTAEDWVIIRLIRAMIREFRDQGYKSTNNRVELEKVYHYMHVKLGALRLFESIRILEDTDKMFKEFGEQCKDYEPGCACCEGWRLFYNNNYKIPTDKEVFDACRNAQGI